MRLDAGEVCPHEQQRRLIIEDLSPGPYILQVTLMGYAATRSDFDVTDADVDPGAVTMTMEAIEVDRWW